MKPQACSMRECITGKRANYTDRNPPFMCTGCCKTYHAYTCTGKDRIEPSLTGFDRFGSFHSGVVRQCLSTSGLSSWISETEWQYFLNTEYELQFFLNRWLFCLNCSYRNLSEEIRQLSIPFWLKTVAKIIVCLFYVVHN